MRAWHVPARNAFRRCRLEPPRASVIGAAMCPSLSRLLANSASFGPSSIWISVPTMSLSPCCFAATCAHPKRAPYRPMHPVTNAAAPRKSTAVEFVRDGLIRSIGRCVPGPKRWFVHRRRYGTISGFCARVRDESAGYTPGFEVMDAWLTGYCAGDTVRPMRIGGLNLYPTAVRDGSIGARWRRAEYPRRAA